ncbi:TPA: SEL1-like repeat protein [Proteus mirabilis]
MAQNNLAINYYYGKGVKRNLKEAYAWFAVAVENGEGDEAMLKRTARALNAAQLAEAKLLAASYIAKYLDD